MTPTPPTHDDDILDLTGLDAPAGKTKASAQESDFEKELEALFAEELDSGDEKPAAYTPPQPAKAEPAKPVKPAEPAEPEEEDILLLDDLMEDAPAAQPAGAADEDVLDLSAFAAGADLDISPPEEVPGGKNGDIDLGALDELISGIGEAKEAPKAAPEAGMADLLDALETPKAADKSQPDDEMLDLSLDDLVEVMPAAEPLAAAEAASAPAAVEEDILDLTLPDLSDPVPLSETLAEQDLGGELNLSVTEDQPALEVDQVLGESDLDLSGLMEGIEAPGEPQAAETSLDPMALLDQIPEGPAEATQPVAEAPAAAEAPAPAKEGGLSLGDMALGAAAVAGAAALGAAAVHAMKSKEEPAAPAPGAAPEPASAALPAPAPAAAPAPAVADAPGMAALLAEVQAKLAELKTQVMGGSVSVVRLEGQLAQKDEAILALEARLEASQKEAQSLRSELTDLRGQLEETLSRRSQADEKSVVELKERLALVEDRQALLDRDVRSEIEKAVPREAARVIREEIAHLAASMTEE